jgi:hypothetical protein
VTAIRAGILYALLLFGIGFLLALIRIPVLVPRLGETASVLIELPVMLAAAWLVAGAILRRTPLSPLAALLMGAAYLPTLLGAELALGLALGGTLPSLMVHWGRIPGSLGLAAQIAVAAFPRLRVAR